MRILAIDPGRQKCGLAVVDRRDGVLARGVVPVETLELVLRQWITAHRPRILVVGNGTSLRQVRSMLASLPIPLETVPETNTTLRARTRYFEEHPPRGWRRLIPRTLQTPPVPIDDYAAVLIAEAFFARQQKEKAADR